jgi:hypothetical protein
MLGVPTTQRQARRYAASPELFGEDTVAVEVMPNASDVTARIFPIISSSSCFSVNVLMREDSSKQRPTTDSSLP